MDGAIAGEDPDSRTPFTGRGVPLGAPKKLCRRLNGAPKRMIFWGGIVRRRPVLIAHQGLTIHRGPSWKTCA